MKARFTESTVEDAALSWFGELEYAVAHGPADIHVPTVNLRGSEARAQLVYSQNLARPHPDPLPQAPRRGERQSPNTRGRRSLPQFGELYLESVEDIGWDEEE